MFKKTQKCYKKCQKCLKNAPKNVTKNVKKYPKNVTKNAKNFFAKSLQNNFLQNLNVLQKFRKKMQKKQKKFRFLQN